jgi:hypothetical protein
MAKKSIKGASSFKAAMDAIVRDISRNEKSGKRSPKTTIVVRPPKKGCK